MRKKLAVGETVKDLMIFDRSMRLIGVISGKVLFYRETQNTAVARIETEQGKRLVMLG